MSTIHWKMTHCPVFNCGHEYKTNDRGTISCSMCGISISETTETNDREVIYAVRNEKRKERSNNHAHQLER